MTTQEDIAFRLASSSDTLQVLAINTYWIAQQDTPRKQEGLLRNPLSGAALNALIARAEIVVAVRRDLVLAYYFATDADFSPEVARRRALVQARVAAGLMPSARYAYLTQAAVMAGHQKTGLGKSLLAFLKTRVAHKFDVLIGEIDDENTNSQIANLRSGWSRLHYEAERKAWIVATPTS